MRTLNHAITRTNVAGVARTFGALASSAGALTDTIEAEDHAATAEQLRRQAV